MNTKDYISSGILEMYVMGVTSLEETREVETFAQQHAEIKAEIESIRKAMENYISGTEKNPPADLKEKIFSEIKKESLQKNNFSKDAKVIPLNPDFNKSENKSQFIKNLLVAASLALLVTSAVFNYVFYTNWKNTETQLVSVNGEKDGYAMQMQVQKTNFEETSKTMALLTDTANKIIKMKGMAIAPQAMATIYWNPISQTVAIDVNNLPMPPSDKQYQLWAIVDGKPVSEGVFEMGNKTVQMMQKVSNAQAFAVTLEKKGGSPTPTMSAMYVLGKV
ncbi:MAG: anti-sigma factor [Bacteroidia bacterium]